MFPVLDHRFLTFEFAVNSHDAVENSPLPREARNLASEIFRS
jgi:hypothetical protein